MRELCKNIAASGFIHAAWKQLDNALKPLQESMLLYWIGSSQNSVANDHPDEGELMYSAEYLNEINCSGILLWSSEIFILQMVFAIEQEELWKECHHELLKLSWYLKNTRTKEFSFQESFTLHHNHKFLSSLKDRNFLSSFALPSPSTSHRENQSLMWDWIWK